MTKKEFMKLKVGDKVRIVNKVPKIDNGPMMVESMYKFLGTIMTIEKWDTDIFGADVVRMEEENSWVWDAKMIKEKVDYYRVLCTKCLNKYGYAKDIFTVGKVYEVVDGKIKTDKMLMLSNELTYDDIVNFEFETVDESSIVRVKCVKNEGDGMEDWFVVGKIYEKINGRLYDDAGNVWQSLVQAKDPAKWEFCGLEFVDADKPEEVKKPKVIRGKCVYSPLPERFTVGKIYEKVDGKVIANDGYVFEGSVVSDDPAKWDIAFTEFKAVEDDELPEDYILPIGQKWIDDVVKIFKEAFEKAVDDLICKPEVKEVKRVAMVGEYIKIVNKWIGEHRYENGDIFEVKGMKNGDNVVYIDIAENKEIAVFHYEYVVLENYKPEEEYIKNDVKTTLTLYARQNGKSRMYMKKILEEMDVCGYFGCYPDDVKSHLKFMLNSVHGKPAVKEVKRNAKVGEWIKITDKLTWEKRYENGDIFQVKRVRDDNVVEFVTQKDSCTPAYPCEFVVLENYKPKKKHNDGLDAKVYIFDELTREAKIEPVIIDINGSDSLEVTFSCNDSSFKKFKETILKGSKPEVKEVHRKAKRGDYIKIVNVIDYRYANGNIFKVKGISENDCVQIVIDDEIVPVYDQEYVVLENYDPEK